MKAKGRLAISLIAFLACCNSQAGIVFRCVAPDGTPNYSSKPIQGVECKPVAMSGGTSNWEIILRQPDFVVSMHKNLRRKGSNVEAWLLYTYYQAKQTRGGKSFLSMKQFETFDCDGRTELIRDQVFYSDYFGTGDLVGSWKTYSQAQPDNVVPDSIGDAASQIACNKPQPAKKA